jgi:DNA-directed RNA polymerase subunit E'/Rpb7
MYIPGQIVEGVITGIQPYGAFVYIDEKTSGLVHIYPSYRILLCVISLNTFRLVSELL